jgi:hypothetical protein
MPSRCTALCATLFATLATPAHAGAHWLCSISGEGTRLVCVADVDPADESAAASGTAPTAVVNGTKFPLDAARLYTVEMWSPPTDLAFVTQLARSTICYRSPGCRVTLAPSAWLQMAGR